MKRREFLQAPAWGACSAAIVAGAVCADETSPDDAAPNDAAPNSAARDDAKSAGGSRRRVRQSVMGWCFKGIPPVELAKHCKRIGFEAIEGIGPAHYDAVSKLGIKISLVSSHGFANGPLDPDNHAMVEAKLRDGIDLAVRYGAPNVITFTGMKKEGISDAAARKNCLAVWKRVMPYAEQKGVGIVLEHLNSKDDSHPMKGHPGYWGDDVHLCADLVKAVDSPRFQLLFDIYHVQIMNGDLIRNVDRYHEIVGHYHTAGNPGRGELDETQEIQYPAVIRAIMKTGYDGYIAQEFIPTSADPIASLEQAFAVCDV